MRDIPPPQGLKGLLRQKEEKEEEGCEPCQEELQLQGVQGQWLPLGRRLPTVPLFCQCPCILSIKDFVVMKLVCLL